MKFWFQMRWLSLRSLPYRFRSWIRRVLDVPARGEVEAIYMQFDVQCRDRIESEAYRLADLLAKQTELIGGLTHELRLLLETVRTLASWAAKQELEKL